MVRKYAAKGLNLQSVQGTWSNTMAYAQILGYMQPYFNFGWDIKHLVHSNIQHIQPLPMT
jgi:hypothetical protein